MFIENLKLTNFRSHAQTDLGLARVNIFRGANGAGKSSIQMAIELALTGRCDVTDQAGRGADALVCNGAAQLGVELTTNTGYRIQASRSKAGGNLIVTYNDEHQARTFTGRAAQTNIETNFAPVDVLSAVLNAHRFLELKPAEQKALLAAALRPDPVAIDSAITDLMPTATGSHVIAARVTSAAEVDALYKQLYDLRADVNRQIKAIGAVQCPNLPEDMPTAEYVSEQIASLQRQRDAAVASRAAMLGNYQGEKARYDVAVSRRRAAEQEKERVTADALDDDELNKLKDAEKNGQRIASIEREIANLQIRVNQARDRIVYDRRQLAGIDDKLATLRDVTPTPRNCGECGRKYTPKVPTEKISELESERQETVDTITQYEEMLANDEKSLADKQTERRKMGDVVEQITKLNKHRAALPTMARAEMVLRETANMIEPTAPDTAKYDDEISTLDERLTRGREVEQQVANLTAQKKLYEQQAKQRAALEDKSRALDRLVEYFSDKGPLKAKLIGGKLPAFVERMNGVLNRFGFHTSINLEPYTIIVGVGRNNDPKPAPGYNVGLFLHQLSESEAYRFGIAFQVALAEATGVGLVIVDRADMLTDQARRQLSEELMESRLDQAFVLATGETGIDYPQIPGVAFYELTNDNGTTIATLCSVAQEEVNAAFKVTHCHEPDGRSARDS